MFYQLPKNDNTGEPEGVGGFQRCVEHSYECCLVDVQDLTRPQKELVRELTSSLVAEERFAFY